LIKKTIELNVQLKTKIYKEKTKDIKDHLPRLVRVSQTTLVFAAANKRECNVRQAILKENFIYYLLKLLRKNLTDISRFVSPNARIKLGQRIFQLPIEITSFGA